MRCVEAGRGVKRAREPDWVVISIGDEVVVEAEEEGRRVIEEGKCEVWNVLW